MKLAKTGKYKDRPGIAVPEHLSPCERVDGLVRFFAYTKLPDGRLDRGQTFDALSFHAARQAALVEFHCEPSSLQLLGPFKAA